MKLAYVVKLNWRDDYMFDDMEDASIFAISAAAHRTEDSGDEQISIRIIDVDKEEVSDD